MRNERTHGGIFSTYEIAYLSMTVAASVVGRLLFQFIPNVQPMTAIFLIITLQLGITRGLIVNVLSLLVTNLYMGMGVWTLSQICSFSLVILLMGLLARIPFFRKHKTLQIIYSILAGFLYGFVISLFDYKVYGMSAFLPYYLAGVSFDAMHAAGNGAFYLLLSPIFNQLVKRISPQR